MEIRVPGRVEGDNNGRLKSIRQQCFESKSAHTLHHNAVIFGIARAAARNPAFRCVRSHSGIQRGDHMHRRSNAPLAVFRHGAPLVLKVEAQGMGVASRRPQDGFADDDKSQPRHAFQAFVAGRHNCLTGQGAHIQGQGSERTHGIHQKAAVVRSHHPGDILERSEIAAGGLAVDGGHMG